MARKTYSRSLMIIDIILTLLTGGVWLVVVFFREYRRRNR